MSCDCGTTFCQHDNTYRSYTPDDADCDRVPEITGPEDEDDEDELEECGECGGDGFVEGDCFEDTCCCSDPLTSHGLVPCPSCKPRRTTKQSA